MSPPPPLRVWLLCTGLGRVARGFETVTAETVLALHAEPGLALRVFQGGPTALPHATTVWNLPRAGATNRAIAGLLRWEPYFLEQATFALPIAARLLLDPPELLVFSDLNLGNALWHLRRRTGGRYRMLFVNGGGSTAPFTRCDLVQHVTHLSANAAIARGEPGERQRVLPHALALDAHAPVFDRAAERSRLGLPVNRPIVVSVGVLSAHEKRMDYVIDEVAACAPRPHLLLLGQRASDTEAILARATARLGADGFTARTLPRDGVAEQLRVADAFVMASRGEGFGLVYIEALAQGLPVIADDNPLTRELLAPIATLAPLAEAGALTRALTAALAGADGGTTREARARFVHERFSWDALRERYVALYRDAAAAPLT
ncbi:MAG: glycosyltransferase [Gemmatimonadaceae bacterium]|nr:glycosyltransferase [Gemmatimonadaceae bacterium]